METFLLIVVLVGAVIRWVYVRQRLDEMGARIDALSRLVAQSQARTPQTQGLGAPTQGLGVGGWGLGAETHGPTAPTQGPGAGGQGPGLVPPPPVAGPGTVAPPPKVERPTQGPWTVPPPPVVVPPIPHTEPLVPVLQPAASVSAPPTHTAPPPSPAAEAPVLPAPVLASAPPQPTAPPPSPAAEAPVLPAPVLASASPQPTAPPPSPAAEAPAPGPRPPAPVLPPPGPFASPAPAPRRSSADWEAFVGGNLVNKAGVLLTVIGLTLFLGYAFTQTGPLGRVLMSLAVSLGMLISGAVFEKREKYRTFAQGLLGGGWAALYFTVYAMQSIDAARVIHSPLLGAILLLAVATGMIVHSLKYRSQTITGLAYFIAFGTLGITQVTPLSVLAVIPLSASLLYVSQRFDWKNFALFGLAATYVICATRGDNGAPLWQVQALFATYWLMFEAFDLLRPHRAMLPANALGFLTLSIAAWLSRAPHQIWELLAAVSIAYLAGAILGARSDLWRPPITLTAALAAAAIFLKLDYQWVAVALLIEAELFYLAGVRLNAPYLRNLATGLFTIELGHLIVRTLPD